MKKIKHQIRRERLGQLIKEQFSGKQVLFAEHVGIPANLISRYLQGVKGIGEDMRIKIEESCKRPRGWLDGEKNILSAPEMPRRIAPRSGINIKQNLTTLMTNHKVNSNSLALATKVPQPTIHRILSGESQDPRTATLEPIATYFGVTVSDLREKDVNEIGLTSNTKNACAFVPLIAWTQAGEIAHMVDVEGSEQIPTTVEKGRHTFALEVVGDAMSPDFPPGTRLIVEPDMGHQAGDYVIVHSGGQATFKQLVRDGADWYLKPINPQYPTKSLGNARIIGVVREALRKLK